MAFDEVLLEAEEKMMKAEEHLQHELAGIRTGKASPALVENLMVDAYGSQMRLKEVAGITTSERRPERVYMPNHPLADDSGFVYAAAVNVEEEFVEMLEAKRQYQNNVEVVTTLRALMMRTINMGK